ncbi:MAG: 30S ribosomal protein S1 [Desulfobacteraceae bacterium]
MTDKFGENGADSGEEMSFADMLEAYDSEVSHDIRQGDRIEGEILSIGKDQVYIGTGTKSDGVVDKADLLDENGEFLYSPGDRVKLYVVSKNESEIILSKAMSGAGTITMLEEASHNRTPVEGKVSEIIKGGLSVEVMGQRCFCPVSQIDIKYVEDPGEYVGHSFHFFITRFAENGRNIVVSRRDLLEEEQKEARKSFFDSVAPGDVLQGRVTRLMPYGAFVEVAAGVEGMVHISELSWSRVEKSEEVVAVGDVVDVKLLGVQDGGENKNPKISLSMKQVSSDPWERAGSLVTTGDQVTGKVVRIAPFGAFVEIAPGLDGLVHLSEMSYTRRVVKADDVVSQGEMVEVVVKDVDLEKKRISLSVRDAHGDPWTGVVEKYQPGTVVQGVVEKKEQFGIFTQLEPGVTGLIPSSSISKAADSSGFDKLKPGDQVTVLVVDVDPDKRRISLAPPELKESDAWKAFVPKEKKSTGTMGDIFKAAMEKKKR